MLKLKIAVLALTASALAVGSAHADWQPKRPVQFVVASGTGGGTDIFARTVQAIIQKHNLMAKPIVVLNKGGGSGAEAFIYGRVNKADPYKVIFGTNNEYLLPLVTKLAYTPDSLTPVAAMAFDEFLIWVNAKSKYKTAGDFIAEAKANPGKIKFAGSQSKDTDQTLVSLIEQKTGAKFTYVPFNGGGEVSVQLAGGHVDANVNNPSENVEQWKAGAIRPLCVFSAKPMAKGPAISGGKGWSDIPTCVSQGIPVKAYEMPRTIWLPEGTPADAVAYYQSLFKKVSETPEWKSYIEHTSQSGEFMSGKDFKEFRQSDRENASKVFKAEGWAIN